MRERSRARGWALQTLYAWEMRGGTGTPSALLGQFAEDRKVSEASRGYATQLLDAYDANRPKVETTVEGSLSNWRMERLSVIDRNILRLAATEMMFVADVPPRVSIQEAIVLAEKYGTNESPRFVNGVLDALMRALEPAHREAQEPR